jgi:DNA-binding CsgD family transcriptional regulator
MARQSKLRSLRVSERQIRSNLGLTPAEARVVYRLVRGMTLRQATQSARISYETGRTQLKSIFRKTGAHSQPALMLLIARIASTPALALWVW